MNYTTLVTGQGTLRGILASSGQRAFRGIPYALPPTGDRRWKPPIKHHGWNGTLDATQFGHTCLQNRASSWATVEGMDNMSEDCLYVNVVAPVVGSTAAPVYVYIHAGEFHYGAGSDRESDWPNFASDCILVTFNYRIGIFGFLASEDLRDRSERGGTGNYGVLDQRMALHWVRRHISDYGGDSGNVILWGESSGGTSVSYHLVSHRSHGLFERAIMQSPGLTQVKALSDAELNYRYVLSALAGVHASSNCTHMVSLGYTAFYNALSSGTVIGGGNASAGWSKKRALAACNAMPSCIGFTVSRPQRHSYYVVAEEDDSWEDVARERAPPFSSVASSFRWSPRHGRDHHRYSTYSGNGSEVSWLLRSAYHVDRHQHNRTVYAPVYDMRTSGECAPPCATFLKAAPDGDAGVACLLSANASDLVVVSEYVPRDDSFETDGWAPVVDGVDTKRSILADINEGRIMPNVTVLLGSNLDEGTIFMYLTPVLGCTANATDFRAWSSAFYGDALGPAVASAYLPDNLTQPLPVCAPLPGPPGPSPPPPPARSGAYYMGAMRSAGDYAIGCKVRQASHALAQRGHLVHEYLFTATPTFSLNYQDLPSLGAFHGAEVPFAFGDAFELKTAAEKALSRAMGCYWRNFAWSGDPNMGPADCNELVPWPRFGRKGEEQATLVLGTKEIKVEVGLKREQCAAFHPG